jgi:hypothetical protein
MDLVPRPLVVEGEAGLPGPDLGQAAVERQEALRLGRRPAIRRRGLIGGIQRRLGEEMQDIHQDQLLMLLLMRQAKVEAFANHLGRRARQQPLHGRIDMLPISADQGAGWPRQ